MCHVLAHISQRKHSFWRFPDRNAVKVVRVLVAFADYLIFFYESRNDERAMLITEVFVLKLESWPLQFVTQIICLSISQTIANTKSNGRVRYFICWHFMILQINVIFFNRQNTSQQKVRRQSGTEKHGSINEDLWIYFDPVYFAQTINYYWIQWVSLLITLVHYINNNSSLETFSPVRKLCTCIVLSWTEGNTAGAWTATLSNFHFMSIRFR